MFQAQIIWYFEGNVHSNEPLAATVFLVSAVEEGQSKPSLGVEPLLSSFLRDAAAVGTPLTAKPKFRRTVKQK